MRAAGFSLTGRHVLTGLLGFFGVVCAVNAAMVWMALSSWPGLSGGGYRDAAAQRAIMAAGRAIAARGWKADLAVSQVDGRLHISVTVTDREDRPVRDISLVGHFRRSVVDRFDRMLALRPGPDGRHAGGISLPAKGQWTLRLVALREGRELWAEDRAIWLN